MYEFLWWSVHKKFLLEEDFYEQTLYSFLSNDKHDNNNNANTNRDAFAVDYIGKFWGLYCDRMLLKATISSHRSGKERFGAQEVLH